MPRLRRLILAIFCAATAFPVYAATSQEVCPAAPEPVVSLSFGSRYASDSDNRSALDEKSNAEVDAALEPVDDFLRSLTQAANALQTLEKKERIAAADCILGQIAVWAQANALGDLASNNAKLTMGSRIAGFGLVLMQVEPHTKSTSDLDVIRPWLSGMMAEQMLFWEEDASKGSKRGNLRAWAALAGVSVGVINRDPVIEGWATASAAYIMCISNEDGSLPQEMSRGKWALHYQLHAIAPLVLSTALLMQQGTDLTQQCDNALERIVGFAISDLSNEGAASEEITGEAQSLFDGTRELKNWQLAWLEAYNSVYFDQDLVEMTEGLRPLIYSKLGGDQTLIWAGL